MARRQKAQFRAILALLGAGNGLLLGRGLELCFGLDRYLLIMLLGALAGMGVAASIWIGRVAHAAGPARPGGIWPLAASSAGPFLAVFAAYFIWRVLPLIREELAYYP